MAGCIRILDGILIRNINTCRIRCPLPSIGGVLQCKHRIPKSHCNDRTDGNVAWMGNYISVSAKSVEMLSSLAIQEL